MTGSRAVARFLLRLECGGVTRESMTTGLQLRRRRSDLPEFIQTNLDVDALAEEIFARYVGEQDIAVEGVTYSKR